MLAKRKSKDDLLRMMDRTREKMFEAADIFGMRSDEVLALSSELDELHNEYMGVN